MPGRMRCAGTVGSGIGPSRELPFAVGVHGKRRTDQEAPHSLQEPEDKPQLHWFPRLASVFSRRPCHVFSSVCRVISWAPSRNERACAREMALLYTAKQADRGATQRHASKLPSTPSHSSPAKQDPVASGEPEQGGRRRPASSKQCTSCGRGDDDGRDQGRQSV
ncbi:hypothetical protein MTO96_001771 [Rhipicephalus appendiculatus]